MAHAGGRRWVCSGTVIAVRRGQGGKGMAEGKVRLKVCVCDGVDRMRSHSRVSIVQVQGVVWRPIEWIDKRTRSLMSLFSNELLQG